MLHSSPPPLLVISIHSTCLNQSLLSMLIRSFLLLLLLSLYFISYPALILILPEEAHFVQRRGYLEPVLTLDGTLDKYPRLRNHKTNGRPGARCVLAMSQLVWFSCGRLFSAGDVLL